MPSWATFHEELLRERVHVREWDGFLPADDEEVAQARAWLCWRALAVGDAEMSAAIRKAQLAQERLLRDELRQQGTTYAPESIEIRLLSHTLDALVDALIDPVAPLDRADVSQVWEGHHARLLSGGKAA